jgi:hypothetical protein
MVSAILACASRRPGYYSAALAQEHGPDLVPRPHSRGRGHPYVGRWSVRHGMTDYCRCQCEPFFTAPHQGRWGSRRPHQPTVGPSDLVWVARSESPVAAHGDQSGDRVALAGRDQMAIQLTVIRIEANFGLDIKSGASMRAQAANGHGGPRRLFHGPSERISRLTGVDYPNDSLGTARPGGAFSMHEAIFREPEECRARAAKCEQIAPNR